VIAGCDGCFTLSTVSHTPLMSLSLATDRKDSAHPLHDGTTWIGELELTDRRGASRATRHRRSRGTIARVAPIRHSRTHGPYPRKAIGGEPAAIIGVRRREWIQGSSRTVEALHRIWEAQVRVLTRLGTGSRQSQEPRAFRLGTRAFARSLRSDKRGEPSASGSPLVCVFSPATTNRRLTHPLHGLLGA
jgi:hypothetical protein